MHDCRNDSVNLYRQFGIRLRNVFDTQVAHIVIQMTPGGNTEDQDRGSSGTATSSSTRATTTDQQQQQQKKSENAGAGAADDSEHRKPPNSKNISLNNLCGTGSLNTFQFLIFD